MLSFNSGDEFHNTVQHVTLCRSLKKKTKKMKRKKNTYVCFWLFNLFFSPVPEIEQCNFYATLLRKVLNATSARCTIDSSVSCVCDTVKGLLAVRNAEDAISPIVTLWPAPPSAIATDAVVAADRLCSSDTGAKEIEIGTVPF